MFADSDPYPQHNIHIVHDAVFHVAGNVSIKTNYISQRQVSIPSMVLLSLDMHAFPV